MGFFSRHSGAIAAMALWIVLILGFPVLAQSPRDELTAVMRQQAESQVNLYWLLEGLRDLEQSRNTRLNLTRAQAQKILPVLNRLVEAGVLDTEVRTGARNGADGERRTQWIQGAQQGRQVNDAQLRQAAAELRKALKVVTDAMDEIESYLTSDQVKFIDNMKFDPSPYGLGGQGPLGAIQAGSGGPQALSQQGSTPNARLLQEARDRHEKAMKARVDLTNRVITLVRAKAGR